MSQSIVSPRPARSPIRRSTIVATAILAMGACAAVIVASSVRAKSVEGGGEPLSPDARSSASQDAKETPTENGPLTLPHDAWKAAGLELGPVASAMFQDSVKVTGKVTFNEERVAHVFPQVAGRVEAVHVRLGQHVKAGEPLVTIESPEIGNAKLTLYRDRLLSEFAVKKDAWIQDVARNTHELVQTLRKQPAIEDLDSGFRDKRLGRNRDQLIAAYSNLRKSRLDYERAESMASQGVSPGKQLIASKATYEGDLVTFQALLETLDQEENYNSMLSAHTRQEAENRVAVDEASLKLLGFSESDLSSIDPIKEGKALSQCPLRSPFQGIVISKDVALMERVGLDHEIATVADVSSVWVKADIFEQHLPLLAELSGKTIEVTSAAWTGKVFYATVFHTGAVVDEASRTIGLRAVADNAEGHLKPGMFVEIRLPGEARAATAIVPVSAIQEHEGKSFVFIHLEDDRFERRDVALGRKEGDRQEVVSGLKSTDVVVVKGGFAIKSRMLAGSLGGD